MDEQLLTLEDYLAILRRRKWQLIVPMLLLSVIAVLAALLIPATYRSSATILIERQEIPDDLVRTTVTGYADQRIQVISQRVMTTANLSKLIERYNLYPEIRAKESINMAVDEMRERVKLDMISADVMDPRSGRPQEATIAFSLAFEDASPTVAQKVTSELVSLFLSENLERRTAAANEATSFLKAEADRLGQQISTLEARLADFKEKNGDNLPELMSLNRELMMRTEERLRDNAQSKRTLEQQAIYLESELAQLSPTVAGSGGASLEGYLEQLQAQYVRIKEKYSPEHPDRIQMEREIASLQQMAGDSGAAPIEARLADLKTELASLRKRYSDDHPDVVALRRSIDSTQSQLAKSRKAARNGDTLAAASNNPAYVQLLAKLDSTRIEIDSLTKAHAQLEQQLAQYEERIKAAPKIEQEYRALTRDYENASRKYQEVREKSLQAELAQALERDRKGERFSLIEPPLVPEKPFKPNRLAIMVLGFVLSIAGGIGNLALREGLDKGLHGPRAIQSVTKIPVLALIPRIDTEQDRERRKRHLIYVIGSSFAALVFGALLFHLLVMPLDVLWFTLMRRLDILMLSESTTLGAVLWNV
ncbi:GumC family protein [Thiorhodococcus fuscus]|uniref:GumC family protein n=1 Tax=Thiorhodococcus fuscus TaxID=527200 RepID=A0ABW4YCH1_9GAMM